MLLESLIAISLIAVVMAAFTTFFVNSVAFTNTQRAAQAATQIANSSVDTMRALPPSDLSAMLGAIDPNALTGTGQPVPVPALAVTRQVNNVNYSATVTLGVCVIATGVKSNASCSAAALSTGVGYLRAAVTVTWSGTRCPPTLCSYSTSTLLSTVDDPLFNVDQSATAAPTLSYPASDPTTRAGNQLSAVNDTIRLLPTVTAVPTVRVAITAGSLPVGLFLDTSTGIITGVPSAVSGATSVTLTLSDGFGRSTSVTFNWTVLAAVSATPPPAQASVIGSAVTALTINATGGTVPYVWSDPSATLPPGLSLTTNANNQAVVTGTPVTAGLPNNGILPQTFSVVLTVKDTAGRTATVPIAWTINYPPFSAAVPGPQTSTIGTPDTLALTVTGGSGSFTWTSAALPPGMTLTSAGVLSGTPSTLGITTVNVTVTDTKSVKSTNPTVYASQNVTFQWTVFATPTVSGPGNQSVTVGYVVPPTQLATTCPNTPCTYVLNNGPATFAINGSGVFAGTVTSAAQTFNNVTVSVTDSSGATVTSTPFVLTVNPVPTISNPGNQLTAPGGAASLNAAALAAGGTPPLTYSAGNLPSWLSLNPSTGTITGTAPAAVTTTGITLTVRDADGITATSPPFNWVVAGPPSAPPNTVASNGDGTTVVSWTAPLSNGAAVTAYTVTLSNGGGACSTAATSCSFSGLTDGVVYAVNVKATNSYGAGPATTVNAIPFPSVMSAANGMTLWLDGADPSVLFTGTGCTGALATSATPIGCWKDKSPQGENFNQTTAAAQPNVGTWNSLSAANFADPGRILNSINAADQYQTVFVATNLANPASSGIVDLFGYATNDFNVRIGSGVNRNSPNGNDWTNGTSSSSGPLDWTNGVQLAPASSPTAAITTDISQSVQSFAASVSNTFNSRGIVGQVGDVITFNTVLTIAQRHAVEDYLAHKWGVPIKPSAPLAPGAVSGNSAIAASWTAPATGQVVSYTATASPGGAACTTSGLSCTINNLTSGVAYTISVTASNDFGTGPAATVSGQSSQPPAVMSASNGMSLWLDGADPNFVLASSACTGAVATASIGCWKDRSGSGENFVQATTSGQPAVGTWNGRSAINFADAGRILNSVDSNGRYQTVFIAANVTNAAAPNTLVDLFGYATRDYNVRIGSNTGRTAPNGNDWSNAASVNGLPANWTNGAQAVTANQPIALVTTDQASSVQSFPASVSNTFYGRGVIGQVGEIVTFNRVLTAAERRSVEEYLGAKWGVVLTPSAPASISASRASATSVAVTLTAPSSNGGAPVTGYTVTASGGRTCTTTGALTCTVTGLTTGTSYTFTATATNSAGIGPASAVSGSVTP